MFDINLQFHCIPELLCHPYNSTTFNIIIQATNGEKFESIPASFWWAIITLTTVGYGDITPISVYGKFVGAACAYFGVLMVALPISVIGNNFSLYYSYAQARMRLPKREENLLWSADKMLIQNEGQHTDSKWMVITVVIYLFKVSNENTRTICKICLRLTIKTPERRY